MGQIKKHIGSLAIDCAMLNIDNDVSQTLSVPTFKNISGDSASIVNRNVYTNNNIKYCRTKTTYCGLTPVATADELSNYNFKDYAITAVGTTTFTTSRTVVDDTANDSYGTHLIYTVTIQNSGANSITVNCIRFKREIATQIGGSYTDAMVLFYSYYLDSPLTIAAGGTESVSVDFYVSN